MGRISWAIGIIFLTVVVRFLQKLIVNRRRAHGLPGPPHSWIWGSLVSMGKVVKDQPSRATPQTCMIFIKDRYDLGDTFYVDPWPLGPQCMFTSDLRLLQEFTVKTNLPKHKEIKTFTRWFGGRNNMVGSDGPQWKKWRAAFNPGFSASHLMANMLPIIVNQTDIFCNIMLEKARTNELFRMETWATKLTVDIIGKVVMDTEFNAMRGKNPLVDAFNSQTRWVYQGAHFVPSELWDIRRPIILRYNHWKMKRYLGKLLDERFTTRSQRGKSKYIVDLALDAYLKEVKGANGDASLADIKAIDKDFRDTAIANINIFIFAGHDTTSSTICYAYHYLSKNPKALARLRDELDNVLGADANAAGDQLRTHPYKLNKLAYTMAVVKEVLRLQPPASTVRAGAPEVMLHDPDTGAAYPTDGFMIWPVCIALHRHAKYWGDPHAFRPERFLEGGDGSKNAFIPFSQGHRNCIGQELAMLELRIVLAMTARRWEFEARYDELEMLKGDGTGYPSDSSGVQKQFGDEAYQIHMGTAKPREGMPCRLKLRW